jgi:8-oxo-dGTP pyrophosphatase MutT (NUDIX family)
MSQSIPEARLSATTLLIRDAPAMEVLLVKRNHEIDFAAGALVFPGGKVNAEDSESAWQAHCDGHHEGAERAVRIAAIREAYEETGIILARRREARGSGGPLVGQAEADGLDPFRNAVERGEASFLDLVAGQGLVLALDTLVAYANWVTPDFMPKRFDTHFFLAATPPDQLARQDGREATEAVWLEPGRAIELEADGQVTIIFPTRMNLKRLMLASHTEDALARFSSQAPVFVYPEVETDAQGGSVLRIPQVEGYGQSTEPMGRVAGVARPHRD